MVGRLESVLRLFREEQWEELHREGCLDDQEYAELTRNREPAALPLSSLDDVDSSDKFLEELHAASGL